MTRLIIILTHFFTVLTTVCTSALAADGTLLVANRSGGSISLIDLPTHTEIARLPIGPVIPHEMAASPDGRWAITGEYGTADNPGRHLVVIDVAAAEIVSRIDLGPDSRPHSMLFLSDNRHVIATMEQSDLLALVDIVEGEVLRTWPTGGRDGHMVRLSPDDSRAYVASRGGEGTLSVIWLNEDRPPAVVPTGEGAEGIAVSPDGAEIWIANRDAQTISIVDADTLEVTATIEGPATNRIEFLPNGQAVIPGGSSADDSARYVSFYDGLSTEIARRLELPGSTAPGTSVRLLAADDLLFLSDSALDEISVLDPASGNAPERIAINTDNPDGMAWSPLRVEVLMDREDQSR
ncbi:MAG TPA: YncE family protein [Gammaproteobacteria bacterium]|nr:YncE family protein [Gammaproteobacteria bacterium]